MKQKISGFLLVSMLFVIVLVTLVGGLMSGIVAILGGEEENSGQSAVVYEESPLSPAVEALRNDVLKELKKYGKEEYINLFLAVIMQESGGNGEDVFQCSESIEKERNSIGRAQSIEHGVKVLCGYLDHDKVKVSSPTDFEHIKIALQAYNYGGGYITYINDTSGWGRNVTKEQMQNLGKWTQANALAYQKKMSAASHNGYPVPRTGSAADILGPYAYGDAYYTKHVLRYYQYGTGDVVVNAKAGEAAKIPYEQKVSYLFPSGAYPANENEMEKYKTTISVPIINENGQKTTINLTVHKKLAEEFKAIFQEMYKEKFPIKASTTYTFYWRTIAGSSTRSQHSYGAAIDINSGDNPCFYNCNADVSKGYTDGKQTYSPGINKYAVTQKIIKIWNAHGFYWGGDWSGKKDTMHFSYTEKPG